MKKVCLVLFGALLASSAFAESKPCSGSKGGIAYCDGTRYVCMNGTYSASQSACSVIQYGTKSNQLGAFRYKKYDEIGPWVSPYENKEQKLVQAYCYSLQSTGECNPRKYIVTADTVKKVSVITTLGTSSESSGISHVCQEATRKATIDGEKSCKFAWDNYGCNGKQYKDILQENDTAPKAKTCLYNNKY